MALKSLNHCVPCIPLEDELCELRVLKYLFPCVYTFGVSIARAVWWVVFKKRPQLFLSLHRTSWEVTPRFLPWRGGAYFPTAGVSAGLVTQFDHEDVDEVVCANSESLLKRPCVLRVSSWKPREWAWAGLLDEQGYVAWFSSPQLSASQPTGPAAKHGHSKSSWVLAQRSDLQNHELHKWLL